MRRGQSSTRGRVRPEHGGAELPPPRRRFGQNFLVDPRAVARIVEAARAGAGERVVEIGPGRGALTEALLASGLSLLAVEIDHDLASALRRRHAGAPLEIFEDDILRVALGSLGDKLVVVGNLPYNISKPVAMKLVRERASIARAVLMFQREVAERLTAVPGTAAYGPLTVLAGRAFAIERLFDLPPSAFRPRPKVDSTVTRWVPRPAEQLPPALAPALEQVLRAAFAHRRQTLLKNLRAGLPDGAARAAGWLDAARLDGGLRAEAVSPEEFVALASVVRAGTV